MSMTPVLFLPAQETLGINPAINAIRETGVRFQDPENFDNRVSDCRDALKGFARSLCKNADDAEDLAQSAITKALISKKSYAEIGDLKAWLFTILRNDFFNQTRRRKSERALEQILVLNSQPEDLSTETNCESTSYYASLLDRLRILSPAHHEVVSLLVKGESYHEISKSLSIPVGTVKSRISRARDFIAKKQRTALMRKPAPRLRKRMRYLAYCAVQKAIKADLLKRPDTCPECSLKGRIFAHHSDYSRPLEIEWVCASCHFKRHALKRRTASNRLPQSCSEVPPYAAVGLADALGTWSDK